MDYKEAKHKFIQAWGTLGSSWGINRAMAQIHALLLISPDPLSTEEIMNELSMSRGNANMNIRALMDWGVVQKQLKPGERKEYFYSDKNIWSLARQVVKERKKRELEPAIKALEEVNNIKDASHRNAKELKQVSGELLDFTRRMDSMLNKVSDSDENWFYKQLMKLF